MKNPTKRSQETSQLLINKITMKDGSVVEFDPENTSGGCENITFLVRYRDVLEMGEAINPSEVYSITIGDTEIILQYHICPANSAFAGIVYINSHKC